MTAPELASHIHWDATTGCHVILWTISGKDKFTKTYFKYEKQYKYVKIKKEIESLIQNMSDHRMLSLIHFIFLKDLNNRKNIVVYYLRS